jgi:hypothetical protein
MKKYLFIVLLVGVCFGQDTYPYFSDMGKQLEFEQKKILVTLEKEKQQVISGGGSEFNWLSLMSNYEPTYKIAPIKTDFKYVTLFNIKRNGKNISEIDFLNFVGLNEQADSLISSINRQIANINNPKNLVFDNRSYGLDRAFINGIGVMGIAGYLGFRSSPDSEEIAFLPALISAFFFHKSMRLEKSKYMIRGQLPTIKSYLTKEQVKSISEAYNRKLYSEIAKK